MQSPLNQLTRLKMPRKIFDIVVNPTGSLFAKTLQQGLQKATDAVIYRRPTPKVLRTIISRKGNVLRQGGIRPHFKVTTNPLNKIEQFTRFHRQSISAPKFALNVEDARKIECKTLFARTLVNSTNGKGIVEFDSSSNTYPSAPLYTEYIPKKSEYRFHVFNGKVIDVQQKKKKRGVEERDTRIRNVNNGYVYCRDGVVAPDGAAELAVKATEACGYQYGAVDVIYNEKRSQCYVLEVNSRPGLMGSTIEAYVKAIKEAYVL